MAPRWIYFRFICKGGLLWSKIVWLSSPGKITGDNRSRWKPKFLPATWMTERGFDRLASVAESVHWRSPCERLWSPQGGPPLAVISKGEPIRIYKLKASGEELTLGNCLLGNLTTARVPWTSALNSIVVHPISPRLYRRACGQGLAGKRPGCLGSWLAGRGRDVKRATQPASASWGARHMLLCTFF